MPQCAFHPQVETNVRCVECDRYICPRDMVATEVGYKCPQCARPAGRQLGGVKPRQYALAVAYALGAGVIGGLVIGQLLGIIHIFPWLFMLLFGAGIGEAARRGAGGHRTPQIAAVGVVGAVIGAFVGSFGLFGVLLAGIGAGFAVLQNRF